MKKLILNTREAERNTKYPTSREINKGEDWYYSKKEINTKWMRKGGFNEE